MDLAEADADRGDTGEHAGRDRQHRRREGPQRAERDQQQQRDEYAAGDRKALDLGFDLGARGDAEDTRARHHEPEPFRCLRRKAAADEVERLLLRIEVGALRARRRGDHGTRRLARDPDAALDARRVRRQHRFGHAHGLAGRVAQQHRLDQGIGGRAEQRECVVDRGAQALDREALGIDRGAQQVAVFEQKLPGLLPLGAIAVVD